MIKKEKDEAAKKATEDDSQDITNLNKEVLPSTDPLTLPEPTSQTIKEVNPSVGINLIDVCFIIDALHRHEKLMLFTFFKHFRLLFY